MIVHMITAFAVSAVIMLMTWAVFRTIKRPMPRYLLPMIVGGTVIAYGIYSEYSWESRTLSQMPESVELVHRLSGKSMFSPWSYLVPRTDRLSVVDTREIRRHPDHAEFVILDLLLMQRFSPVIRVRQIVDCAGRRRADLTSDPDFDDQGIPVGLQWESLSEDHPLLPAACGSG
ncbi:MAG: hypothetical protein HKN42_06865 [Granulosicoccus sp.]|nr:hypothetical protein [Granulosicoccus sp.]